MVWFIPLRDDFWATLTPEEGAVIRMHYEALAVLMDQGKLEFAGRPHDASQGMAIMRADTAAEVEDMFVGNPAIEGGLLRIEVKPYNLALDADPN